MKLKLKDEYKDAILVRGTSILKTKEIKEEDYELYAKRYPHIFEKVIEKVIKPVEEGMVEVAQKNVKKYMKKND